MSSSVTTRTGSVLSLPWPTAVSAVECNRRAHEVGWVNGRLVAIHHDWESEQVIHALGGHAEPCARTILLWLDYRMEPLLPGFLISGKPGLMSRQTLPVFGPSIGRPGRPGLFGLLKPLGGLDRNLRLRLAAASALALDRSERFASIGADDGLAVRDLVRAALRATLQVTAPNAYRVNVELARGAAPSWLESRPVDGGIIVHGRLSIAWLALFSLGVAVVNDELVLYASNHGGKAHLLTTSFSRLADGRPGAATTRAVSGEQLIEAAKRPPPLER